MFGAIHLSKSFVFDALVSPRLRRFLVLAAVACFPCFGSFTFVPGGFANVEADSNGISPLSVGSFYFDGGSQGHGRMDELYDASGFLAFGSGLFISQLAFRNDTDNSSLPFSSTLQNIEVYLDTTTQTIGGISTTFAANQNAPVLVYSGPITFSGGFDSGTPRCFCYVIPFQTTYLYLPGNGNLLLDIKILLGNDPNTSSLPTLDYQRNTPTSAMSILIEYSDGNAATGAVGTQVGWPTQFTLDPVPEPSTATLGLTGFGLAGLVAVVRRARAYRR